MNVTGEQVRAAMIGAQITEVEHHRCSMCGYMTRYLRDEADQLFFDAGCDCTRRYAIEPRSWASAADWINMQSKSEWRDKIAARFGLAADGGGEHGK